MKISSLLATFALIAIMAFASGTAYAQTVGTMPTLYNSSGQTVNTSGGSLGAGYYYLSPGGQQVYYYGDGTYYNSATRTYGGNVSNPTGAAGTYVVNGVNPNPGLQVPNTGAGGNAFMNWALLFVSATVAGLGVVYLNRARRAFQ